MVVNTFNTSPGQAGRSLRSRLARSTWSTYPAKSLPHISRKCKKIKRQLKDGRKEGGKEGAKPGRVRVLQPEVKRA